MTTELLRIQLAGELADTTAEALGCWLEHGECIQLVTRYVDQAQLTGLLVQLADLHISYDRVEIGGTDVAGSDPSGFPRDQGEAQ